jgi:hypothetical protein
MTAWPENQVRLVAKDTINHWEAIAPSAADFVASRGLSRTASALLPKKANTTLRTVVTSEKFNGNMASKIVKNCQRSNANGKPLTASVPMRGVESTTRKSRSSTPRVSNRGMSVTVNCGVRSAGPARVGVVLVSKGPSVRIRRPSGSRLLPNSAASARIAARSENSKRTTESRSLSAVRIWPATFRGSASLATAVSQRRSLKEPNSESLIVSN